MKALDQSKLDSLTGLRYLAALSIVVGHVAAALPGRFDKYSAILMRSTSLGMPLFFLLSGFLMTYNYADKFASRRAGTLRNYAVARFARIYPLYIITMLLSFSLISTFFLELAENARETLKCLGYNLTLTQNWFSFWTFEQSQFMRRIYFAYHGIAWSVSTEAFFYLLFPLVALALPRLTTRQGHAITAAAGVFVVWALIDLVFARTYGPEILDNHSSWPSWFCYRSPYGRFGEFLIGCFVGRLFLLQSATVPSRLENSLGSAVLLIATLAFLWCGFMLPDQHPAGIISYLRQNVGNAPFCATIIFCLARYSSTPQRLLSARPMILLGEASYCIYLIHPFVQILFMPRSADEANYSPRGVLIYGTIAMLLTLHVLSLGFFQFVEAPIRQWLRRVLSSREGKSVVRGNSEDVPIGVAA